MAATILIVEDERIAAMAICALLEDRGYSVLGPAGNATAAAAILAKSRPDIVLMDYRLEDFENANYVNGAQLAKIINQRYEIPVVFMTGYRDQKTFAELMQAEPFCHLQKPFTDEQLLVSVEFALLRHQSFRLARDTRRLHDASIILAGHVRDFNGLLTALSLSVWQLETTPPGDSTSMLIYQMKRNLEKAKGVTDHLLQFARGSDAPSEICNLAEFVRSCAQCLVQPIIRAWRTQHEDKEITCDTSSDADNITVRINKREIEELLLILCRNALKAMPQGGSLRLTVGGERLSLEKEGERYIGEFAYVKIQDTGLGILSDQLDKIFLPSLSSDPNTGFGLDLARAQGIAVKHRGFINAKSAVSQGSTFTVFLPAMPEKK